MISHRCNSWCSACLFTVVFNAKVIHINPRGGVRLWCFELSYTRMAAQHLNHVGINAVAVTWQWILLLSSLFQSFSLVLSLFVCFWLGDIQHLTVDTEKCVCTSTLLSLQSLSKTHVHKSVPNITVQCRCCPTRLVNPKKSVTLW